MTGLAGDGLQIAIPQGALFEGCLDLLDALGMDTSGLRSDSRKLLYEGEPFSVVTMRPSDVPTYVEHGTADLGIVGKDVLAEYNPRVYELLDLGFGACRMVFATPAEHDHARQAQRRLGEMRVATKYPRTTAAYFERTGRQVEVIEVRGSVEIAPLVGLAEGLVDLVATGRTLEENGLVVREEIATCTARLIANEVSHKLKGGAIDAICASARAWTGGEHGAS